MRSQRKTILNVEALESRHLPSTVGLAGNVAVVRAGHDWYLDSAGNGGLAEDIRHFGLPGDHFLAGDWDGNGGLDVLAVRPNAEGGLTWFIDLNGDNQPDLQHRYGLAGDLPVLGDWDYNGTDDPGVVRKNHVSGGLDWYLDPTKTVYSSPTPRLFGLISTGDIPVVGDWDGDGLDTLGVVRPNAVTGLFDWCLDTNSDPSPDIVRPFGLISTMDRPVVGDWNHDDKDDFGVVRANAGTGLFDWMLDTNGDAFADQVRSFGFVSDVAVGGGAPVGKLAAPPKPLPQPAPNPTPQPTPQPSPSPAPTPTPTPDPSRSVGKSVIDVKFLDGRLPAPIGTRVSVYNQRGDFLFATTTDRQGEVMFNRLPTSKYRAIADYTDARGRRFQGHYDFVDRVAHSIWLQDMITPCATRPGTGGNIITVTVKDLQGRNTISGVRVRLREQLSDGRVVVVEEYRSNSRGQVAFYQLGQRRFYIDAFDASKNRWVISAQGAYTTFRREAHEGWTPSIKVGAASIPNYPPLSGNLKPGIYVAARDLEIFRGVVNHQFHEYLILVPARPENFQRENERNLGDGTRGIVIAAHDVNGKLIAREFENADLQATRQFLAPELYTAPLIPDYDAQVLQVNLGGRDVDEMIRKVLKARDRYVSVSRQHPLPYPTIPQQFLPGVINSNSWAQSIIQYTIGPGAVVGSFTGILPIPGHNNRIPSVYFVG